MIYLIGDLQGCCTALDRLLAKIDFSPSRDHLYVLGDLVNRGPESLQVLQRLSGLGESATCLLGNHDLHLLAVAAGWRRAQPSDTLKEILQAPDREAWLDWLRQQKMAVHAHGWLMVHAGVAPVWDLTLTLQLAHELEQLLQTGSPGEHLRELFGNQPSQWDDLLPQPDRWRFAINAFTRMRFCHADGRLDFQVKESAASAPPGLMPWFEVLGRKAAHVPTAFGHWSTLGLINRENLLALDTGCVWGGCLTAMRIDEGRREPIQVNCEQSLAPS